MHIPGDVPFYRRLQYLRNMHAATGGSGNMMLFAGDQRVEHLHGDFYGKGIALEDSNPEHFFRIASRANIGCFATQLGFLSQYGPDYRNVRYVVKLNSKTNLVSEKQQDPLSTQWFSVKQVREFQKQARLDIVGVGYTIYLGSEHEHIMLKEAAQIVHEAHKYGYFTILWIYPRGKAVKDEKSPSIIAGATSVAAALGSDFVKVNCPQVKKKKQPTLLKEAVEAAGRTRVICAGGSATNVKTFLKELYQQIHEGGASGNATGRNIHQKELPQAIAMCDAVYALTVKGETLTRAMKIYNESLKKQKERS